MATKQDSNYILSGRITNLQNQPLPGLIVRAYDEDPLTSDDPLGEAVSDRSGRYTIHFSADALGLEFGGPDVFIRVYRDRGLLGQSPVYRDQPRQITIDFQVDPKIDDPAEPPRLVRGTVRDSRRNLLAGISIAALDRDLRTEQPLGKTRTNDQGWYEISYFARQFRKHEKGSADLVVKAFPARGSLPAVSPVLFNAPPVAEVDLTIPAEILQPPTLFEEIGRALVPLLEGLKVEELEEDKEHQDLSFLSGEIGFEKQTLARFVLAHKLAQQGIRGEFWFVLLGGSFYQFTENQSLKERLGRPGVT